MKFLVRNIKLSLLAIALMVGFLVITARANAQMRIREIRQLDDDRKALDDRRMIDSRRLTEARFDNRREQRVESTDNRLEHREDERIDTHREQRENERTDIRREQGEDDRLDSRRERREERRNDERMDTRRERRDDERMDTRRERRDDERMDTRRERRENERTDSRRERREDARMDNRREQREEQMDKRREQREEKQRNDRHFELNNLGNRDDNHIKGRREENIRQANDHKISGSEFRIRENQEKILQESNTDRVERRRFETQQRDTSLERRNAKRFSNEVARDESRRERGINSNRYEQESQLRGNNDRADVRRMSRRESDLRESEHKSADERNIKDDASKQILRDVRVGNLDDPIRRIHGKDLDITNFIGTDKSFDKIISNNSQLTLTALFGLLSYYTLKQQNKGSNLSSVPMLRSLFI